MDKEELIEKSQEMISHHRKTLKTIRGILYQASTQVILHGEVVEKSSLGIEPKPLNSSDIEEIIDNIKMIIDHLEKFH